MRVRASILFLLLVLFTTGCSARSGESDADKIREHYSELKEATYDVTLRTDFGDRVLDFSVEYQHKTGGGGRMKVISPELIAGIEAEIGANGISLIYDGMTLELGALPGTGLSPMESLPFIVNQWSGGYVTQTGSEKRAGRALITVTTRVTQGETVLEVTTWFEKETYKPVTAELLVDGFLTVSAFFEE